MRYTLLFLVIMCTDFLSAQEFVGWKEVGVLNNILHETSGLQVIFNSKTGNFEGWSHNDHDNTDSIYSFKLNDLNTMTRILDLNMPNSDWEDLARDNQGHIYVGDFGSFSSGDLHILKMADPNSFNGNPATVEKLKFQYPFAGISDMEAMICVGDSIYLFNKSVNTGANPNLSEGITYMFRLSQNVNDPDFVQTAALQDSFSTKLSGDSLVGQYRVTAADLSPDGKKLVLLCYNRLWIFSCFQGTAFFDGATAYVDYIPNQKEGVSFRNNHEVYISKEGKIGTGSIPKIYYINIEDQIDDGCLDCEKLSNPAFGDDTLGWNLFVANNAAANLTIVNGEAKVSISNPGDSLWKVSLRQKGLILEPGKEYRVVFDAYADHARMISAYINDDQGGQYHYQSQQITTTKATYTFDFNTITYEFNGRLTFGLGRDFAHSIYIDNVHLIDKACHCPAVRTFVAPLDNTMMEYSAQNIINASAILSTSNVHFRATQNINLNPGFEVKFGAELEVDNLGCEE